MHIKYNSLELYFIFLKFSSICGIIIIKVVVILIFEKYKEKASLETQKRVWAWKTAIGLQKVDDLTTSDYLYEIAQKNIEQQLSFEEANKLIKSYHNGENFFITEAEEADKASVRIAELILSNDFVFSINEYLKIHQYLFSDIYKHAGKIRGYNISKAEWVLDGKSVSYGNVYNLKELLEYDFKQEKDFKYSKLSQKEFINHLARFIANIWQTHAFCEGNTRTTAVFLIKYLNSIGYKINSDVFYKNSWYFRNALVRANYSNYMLGIQETTYYLELLLENLLFNTNHTLSNEIMHISYNE